MVENAQGGYGRVGWTVLAIAGVLSLASIVVGGLAFGNGIQIWAAAGYVFKGWGMIDWLVGLCGAALAAFGLMVAGLCLRFVPWAAAPLISLGLALVSAAFLATTFVVYSQTSTVDDNSFEIMLLRGLCILGLFVIALPPFLHWLLTRPRSTFTGASGGSGE